MSKSLYKKVGIASAIMTISILLSRVIGLLREIAIAYMGGARGDVDAYQISFVIPEILNHVVASGFLSVTFIPIFTKYLAEDREEEGWRVFSIILNCFGILLITFIVISFFFADELVSLIAPGVSDPLIIQKAVRMTRIIIPAQFFFFIGGLLTAVQFARESFAIPALAPLVYNIGIIAGGFLLAPWIGMEGFSWGVLGGAFLGNFAIQYRGAKKAGMKYHAILNFRHPDLWTYIWLSLPLMVGFTMTFSTEFFLKFFGSFLDEGSIASLNYGLRVMLLLVGFFGQAVGVASYPYMARLAAENKIEEMNRLLDNALRYLSLVLPFSVLLMVLRHEVILILFQRGKFDAAATAQTSEVLVFLLIGGVAFAAQTVVVRGYYAMRNTLFPALFGTVAVVLSLPIYVIGLKFFGIRGIAFALSLSAIFQVTLLYLLWNRRNRNKESRSVYLFFGRMLIISLVIGILLEGFKRNCLFLIDVSTFQGSVAVAVITGILFLVILPVAGMFSKSGKFRKF